MASHDPRQTTARPSNGAARALSSAAPFETAAATSLSWELGDRLTRQTEVSTVASFENPARNRSLTVFEATAHTYLVRVRTPVGREKFYGVARHDVDLGALDGADDWRERDRSA
jgi:hypothetical protein